MNPTLAHSHSSSKRASRARFSPAAHHASDIPSAPIAGSSYSSIASATEDFFSQIWTPGLLDRLQAPLTRYRE